MGRNYAGRTRKQLIEIGVHESVGFGIECVRALIEKQGRERCTRELSASFRKFDTGAKSIDVLFRGEGQPLPSSRERASCR